MKRIESCLRDEYSKNGPESIIIIIIIVIIIIIIIIIVIIMIIVIIIIMIMIMKSLQDVDASFQSTMTS